MMITAINCSILDSTSTYDNDEMNIRAYKPTRFEPTVANLIKETRLACSSAQNLVKRGYNIRVEYT